MVLKKCENCNETGWVTTENSNRIPCVYCNARGVISDQLFSQELIDFDKSRKKTKKPYMESIYSVQNKIIQDM